MKKILLILAAATSLLPLATSCEVDNVDAPACQISGYIVYDGQPLGLMGTNNAMKIELWERGYGLEAAQTVFVGQDGKFSTYVYGKYPVRIVAQDGLGPWENRHDTVYIDHVNGNMTVNYPVVPYFMIEDLNYSLSADSVLTATFTVEQISENANLEQIGLYVNSTRFVDRQTYVASTTAPGNVGAVTLTLDLKNELKNQRFLFARVCIKNRNVDQAVYSQEPYQLK